MRRYSDLEARVPSAFTAKKRKSETEDIHPKQQGNTMRFGGVQRYYAYFRQHIDATIWKTAGDAAHARAINLFHKTNGHCFDDKGKLVDLATFKFSHGELLLPRNIAVERDEDTLRVTWEEERHERNAAPSDRLCVGLVYDRFPDSPHLATEVTGTRGDLAGEFRPDKDYDSPLHIYCFWAREDGSAFSESIHFLAEGND